MLMKPFLLPTSSAAKFAKNSAAESGSASKSARWSFHRAWKWKARRAELEVLAGRGVEKIERSMRVACIMDTTMVRGWLPAAALVSPEQVRANLLRRTLAQMTYQKYNVIGLDAWTSLLTYLGVANTQDDQFTLGAKSRQRGSGAHGAARRATPHRGPRERDRWLRKRNEKACAVNAWVAATIAKAKRLRTNLCRRAPNQVTWQSCG